MNHQREARDAIQAVDRQLLVTTYWANFRAIDLEGPFAPDRPTQWANDLVDELCRQEDPLAVTVICDLIAVADDDEDGWLSFLHAGPIQYYWDAAGKAGRERMAEAAASVPALAEALSYGFIEE